VAMSGGVDSSVAALMLKREGYEIIGVHLKLFDLQDGDESGLRSCCTLESSERVRAVCNKIDAKFYVLNYKAKFEEMVIKPFAEAYLSGRTPNPCVACNQWIKFDALLNEMNAIGVDYIATGHYLRKHKRDDRWVLTRGKDPVKDQSYFLYMLNQDNLDKILFPVGDYEKLEIRKIASDAGLETAHQPESQEICFAQTESYAELIKSRYPETCQEGEIINRKGKVLGHHKGIIHYTIGQRKGMGISYPEPLYVLEINTEANTLTVGTRDEMFSSGLIFDSESFVSGEVPDDGSKVEVQIRYRALPKPAVFIGKTDNGYRIAFDEPQPAVTPGQAVVMYDGDELLGGGTIVKAIR
jgi:tRNA-specific 2-thiouridylase